LYNINLWENISVNTYDYAAISAKAKLTVLENNNIFLYIVMTDLSNNK